MVENFRNENTFLLLIVSEAFQIIVAYSLSRSLLNAFILNSQLKLQLYKAKSEKRANDKLFESALPPSVVERLRSGKMIKTYIKDSVYTGIIYIRLSGFNRVLEMNPVEAVSVLSRLYSRFDDIGESVKCTKIKSVGPIYIGMTQPSEELEVWGENILESFRRNAVLQLAECAWTIRELFQSWRSASNPSRVLHHLTIQIGIHYGNVTTGIIGTSKWLYDCFGETVQVTARLCESSTQSKIICEKAVAD
eukprot:CAMPEP_0117433132 /NCGR_PEP_ID=MMETSP0758-20121206/12535_1 /TAXON_ID=63605 /ORGANISM="Percolomonas cosmopolitus, Strain AE-1 (ATCC 50343)" /LENGTH=248 /DNA_ID=CAMNT_0005223573 /DNA_START=139 /DNA_END=882 /DNA_ORIENTATION=+